MTNTINHPHPNPLPSREREKFVVGDERGDYEKNGLVSDGSPKQALITPPFFSGFYPIMC
jgi:hypothetical protein